MKKLPLSAALICLPVLLTACGQLQQSERPLIVHVKGSEGVCRVTVEGERVTSDRLFEIGRSAPNRRGVVIYGKDAAYKCVGAAIFTLQRAGLAIVDAAFRDGG